MDHPRRLGRIASIYTRPDKRGCGVAQKLLSSLTIAAKSLRLTDLECFYTDAMTGLDDFLKSQGFITLQKNYRESYALADLYASKKDGTQWIW